LGPGRPAPGGAAAGAPPLKEGPGRGRPTPGGPCNAGLKPVCGTTHEQRMFKTARVFRIMAGHGIIPPGGGAGLVGAAATGPGDGLKAVERKRRNGWPTQHASRVVWLGARTGSSTTGGSSSERRRRGGGRLELRNAARKQAASRASRCASSAHRGSSARCIWFCAADISIHSACVVWRVCRVVSCRVVSCRVVSCRVVSCRGVEWCTQLVMGVLRSLVVAFLSLPLEKPSMLPSSAPRPFVSDMTDALATGGGGGPGGGGAAAAAGGGPGGGGVRLPPAPRNPPPNDGGDGLNPTGAP
jgi:hypothetical protein